MKIREVLEYLESIAPLSLQEHYDNAGLLCGSRENTLTDVLVCLDSTEAVVDEAIQKGCNLIIAHHPILFTGITSLTGHSYIERTLIKAIKNDISIYAIHTNLDNVHKNGVNQKIAKKLGVRKTRILKPVEYDKNIGAGLIGELERSWEVMAFLKHVKAEMRVSSLKYTPIIKDSIRTVALCGGSGSFLLNDAIAQNADIFISSDYKYHQFFDSNREIIIADIGHYESEFYTIELIKELLSEKFTIFAAHCTDVNTNPINYL